MYNIPEQKFVVNKSRNLKKMLIFYLLIILHTQSAFRIDGTTGRITVNQILEYNAASVVILTVEAVDLNAVDVAFGKQQKATGKFWMADKLRNSCIKLYFYKYAVF